MNYDNYLQLNKILTAQSPVSLLKGQPKHDEMFFIILHQTHELWFKQIIYEIDFIITEFDSQKINLYSIINKLERIISIFHTLIESINSIETLSPLDFLEFRKLLTPASGLHSEQFKVMLSKFGLYQETNDIKTLFTTIDNWLSNLFSIITDERYFHQLYFTALESWLTSEAQHIELNDELEKTQKQLFLTSIHKHAQYCKNFLNRELYNELLNNKSRMMTYDSSLCVLFILNYRDNPEYFIYYRLISLLQKIDSLIAKWQISHAQIVKNIIGNKLGTGGTYTAKELFKHKKMGFSDINDLVSLLIPKSMLSNSAK